MDNELKDTIISFLTAFEQVFDKDWAYTKGQLGIVEETENQKLNALSIGLEAVYYISPEGTFLKPNVDDEANDWGHRATLLNEYRKLKILVSERL